MAMYEQSSNTQQRGLILQQQLVSNSENIKHRHMKSNKPLLEKKRRARINKSLEQLKTLLMETIRNDTSAGYSKLEKADILEMAVKHLRQMHRQQQTGSSSTDASMLVRYCAGFNECAHEVNRYLTSADGHLGTDLRLHLMNHLSEYISPSSKQHPQQQQQQQPQQQQLLQQQLQQRELYNRQQTRPLGLPTINSNPMNPMHSLNCNPMTSHAEGSTSTRSYSRTMGPMTSSPRAVPMLDNVSLSGLTESSMTSFPPQIRDENFMELLHHEGDGEENSRSMWCPMESLASYRSAFDVRGNQSTYELRGDRSGCEIRGDKSALGYDSLSPGGVSAAGTSGLASRSLMEQNFQEKSSRKRKASDNLKYVSKSTHRSPLSQVNNDKGHNENIRCNNENDKDVVEMEGVVDVKDELVWRPW